MTPALIGQGRALPTEINTYSDKL